FALCLALADVESLAGDLWVQHIHRRLEVAEVGLDGDQPSGSAQLGHFGVRPDIRSGSSAVDYATGGTDGMAGHDHDNVAWRGHRGVQVVEEATVHVADSVYGHGRE